MSNCGCGKEYTIHMGCCQPVLGPVENYYTKHQIDKMIEDIEESGCCITADEVDEKIEDALEPYATEQWVLDRHYITGVDLSDYATHQWVEDKHYLTEHQPLKTINNQVISGTGNIEITGSSVVVDPTLNSGSTNPVANSAITIAIDNKLDASAYTPIDLSEYATKQWVLNKNYATNTVLLQHIQYLQDQINELQVRIEDCCTRTGTTITRWVTMTGASDYMCSGTTKMTKEVQEQSTDGGVTWTRTDYYRMGDTVLEYDSQDCGYIVPMKFNGVQRRTSRVVNIPCDGSSTLTRNEVYNSQDYQLYKQIEIGDCVTTIGENAFLNQMYIERIEIPSGVTTIQHGAFADAGNLSGSGFTLTLNEGLIIIADNAFYGMTNYSALTIPNSVTTIGGNAFQLNEISVLTIGSGVTSIGDFAFARTTGITATSITVLATTPPVISSNNSRIFEGIDCPIYVPAQSVNTYKAATGWNYYADRIFPIQ